MELDLSTTYPRSVHDKLLGLVQIARTIDKAKGAAGGTIGDYHYNCPMDEHVFSFLGIDHEAFLGVVKNAKSDAEIEAYLTPFVEKKTPNQIEAWNEEWVAHRPDSAEAQQYFDELRNAVAPDRTDVTAWADLLDLDEKRNVPKRTAASV
jgi:hypothetical protein